jgi:glycosyltransferase involved in cell wall biosynthesis
MKVLQLYYKMPFPMNDGGAYSIYHSSLCLLSQHAELKILAMDTYRSAGEKKELPRDFGAQTAFESIPLDNRIKPVDAFINLFGRDSYFVERFYSESYRDKLISILRSQHFDVVQLEHLYLCLYLDDIRKHSNARIVLRAQNIEHEIWKQYIGKLREPLRKGFLHRAATRLEAFEKQMITRVDGIMALTAQDADFFRAHAPETPVAEIPLPINMKHYSDWSPAAANGKPPLIYHLGSMDWRPNIQGMQWFIRKVLPLLVEQHPDIRVHMAGKNMPAWFFNRSSKNLIVEGTVEDAVAYQQDKTILIVPLLSGSGIRVKILEGMALGKTIITTAIGAQGIQVTDREHLMIANDAETFAKCISYCMRSSAYCNKLGSNARKHAVETYQATKLGAEMLVFYKQLHLQEPSIHQFACSTCQ